MQIVFRWSYLVLAVDVLHGELHWGWSQGMNQPTDTAGLTCPAQKLVYRRLQWCSSTICLIWSVSDDILPWLPELRDGPPPYLFLLLRS